MFDILEADVVVFQETKIQRKDLTDEMVLVPGWDCYFSLPRQKKGYSGVVIYTRTSVCAPIRAEEGITGTLCPPNSALSFAELPEHQRIGGYPTQTQLAASGADPSTIDSEGRCVILEFPAFVLVGVYSPANRDETRDEFRLGFLDLLDHRIRNLVSEGKRVFLTGDLNISREELDAANAEASMRKQGLSGMEFVSTPARRLFNHLLEGGKVFGDRDEGRGTPILWDICRAFHPDRKGMFTCWEQKVNARPGNCGSRIDYVLCSLTMKEWFSDSNIQEGLMGSDHCPVFAVMKDKILVDGKEQDMKDVMNPAGMFVNGVRQREYSVNNDPLPLSGKLIPEFFGRRNIRDMFTRTPSLHQSQSPRPADTEAKGPSMEPAACQSTTDDVQAMTIGIVETPAPIAFSDSKCSPVPAAKKRSLAEGPASKTSKRSKSNSTHVTSPTSGKGQRTLQGFFKPKVSAPVRDETVDEKIALSDVRGNYVERVSHLLVDSSLDESKLGDCDASLQGSIRGVPREDATVLNGTVSRASSPAHGSCNGNRDQSCVHDPVESKESWSKLFTKPVAPRCEGHDEPCITLLTKKPGMNLGRSFWMCPRPLGPSGAKEKNTQWRCQTFIWCSDWNSNSANGG
ncbi:Class II abasic (AP) endonuclease [Lecanora helva]